MRLLQPVFHSVFCFLIVALSPSLTVAAHTIDDTKSATTKPSESIVADWLAQGERQDFPWQLTISQPLLLYDATLDRRNVTFKRVAVHAPGREPFPELFSQLPRVNFEGGTRVPTFLVSTHRPIQMDLVIEFSSHYVYKGRLHRLIHAPRI